MKGLEAHQFVYAPKVVRSSNVRVTIKALHFIISFNLMLYAVASSQLVRCTKPFFLKNNFSVGFYH